MSTATSMDFVPSASLTPDVVTLWREQMGYSKRAAADALGCSREAFDGWEKGRHRIPVYIGLAMNALALNMRPYGAKRDPVDSEEE